MTGQDRRRPRRAADQGAGHSGRAVGRQPGDAAVRQGEEVRLFPRKTLQVQAGPPVDLSASTARSRPPRCCGRPPRSSWPRSPCSSPISAGAGAGRALRPAQPIDAADQLRHHSPTAARTGRQPQSRPMSRHRTRQRQPQKQRNDRLRHEARRRQAPRERTRDESCRIRHRLLGHGLRDGARRRGLRGDPLGPPRRSSPTRSTPRRTNPDYLPGVELPAAVRATTDAGGGAARRGVHRARRPLPDAARQPRRLGAAAARRTPCWSP